MQRRSISQSLTVDSTLGKEILNTLTNYSNSVSAVNDAKIKMNGKLDYLEKQAKSMKDAAEKGSNDAIGADCAKYVVNQAAKAFTKVFNAQLNLIKEDMKQARKAFVKVSTVGVKGSGANATQEAVEMMEAEMDLQDYEVDSFFEQYSYDFEELTA